MIGGRRFERRHQGYLTFLVALAWLSTFPCPADAKPYPVVAEIMRQGQLATAAPDVVVQTSDLHHQSQGVHNGQALNDVYVNVPSSDTVVVAAPNGHDALTLEPGSRAFFDYTGTQETVSVTGGEVHDSDTYGFFSHVTGRGGIVLTAPLDPSFSIDVTPGKVTVISSNGLIRAQVFPTAGVLKNAPCAQTAQTSANRFDQISADDRKEMAYTVGAQTLPEISLSDDERSAARGDAYAEYDLGSRYDEGRGVSQDYATALHWYQRAAAQRLAQAENAWGVLLDEGRGTRQDYAAALRMYSLAAAQHLAEAEKNIGFMYDDGRGVPRNYSTAMHWYRLAADQGLAAADVRIGYMYNEGRGVPVNYVTAMSWYRRAAAQGSADGENEIGYLYHEGAGVPQNDTMALQWYRLAAAQGFAAAQTDIGWEYYYGRVVPQSYADALRWFRLSALQGLSCGETDVGLMYDLGKGVPRDWGAAMHWYQLGAAQGNDVAQWDIGILYERGHGVPQNYPLALHWYLLAAAQGLAVAQSYAGNLYFYGRGVPQDYPRAFRLYKEAAARGFGDAEVQLGDMYYYGHGIARSYVSALNWYRQATEPSQNTLGHIEAVSSHSPQTRAEAAYRVGNIYEYGLGVPRSQPTAFYWYRFAVALASVRELPVPNPRLPITVVVAPRAQLSLETATTDDERERGLMSRARVLPHTGMLFVYPKDDEVGFWMKDTLVPLDMLFLAPDGMVRSILANAQPLAPGTPDKAISMHLERARYVIELPAGEAARDGIHVGTRLRIP